MVLVPITYKEDTEGLIIGKLDELAKVLKESGIRVYCDDRDNYNPGWKFNHWEVKGTPIRIELGKKDYEKGEVRVVRRDNGEKQQMKWANLGELVKNLLEQIHNEMYERALKTRDEHLIDAYNWDQFMAALNDRNIVLTPWC